jgi:hypothetical protein
VLRLPALISLSLVDPANSNTNRVHWPVLSRSSMVENVLINKFDRSPSVFGKLLSSCKALKDFSLRDWRAPADHTNWYTGLIKALGEIHSGTIQRIHTITDGSTEDQGSTSAWQAVPAMPRVESWKVDFARRLRGQYLLLNVKV